jgi:uncharacterized protein
VGLFRHAEPVPILGDNGSASLLRQIGENVERAAGLLHELLDDWPESRSRHAELVELEHEGDHLVHELIRNLYRAPKSPLQRDLLTLASLLDDIVDFAEEAGDLMVLYRIEAPMAPAVTQSELLQAAAREVSAALADGSAAGHLAEVDRLEKEGDRIEREALSGLFDGGVDPMAAIRWKDVYDRIERAIDSCNSVARLLQGMAIKQAAGGSSRSRR